MLRGNAQQKIFLDSKDYIKFESILSDSLVRFSQRIHAYCWMGNHVHMLIQVADIPLSKMMQIISQRYTKWFNYRYDMVGHLFQGRYKAILVDADHYMLELIRYIHLNPLRANLVQKIDDFRWSSHHAYVGVKTPPWLTTDWVSRQLGPDAGHAKQRYLRLLNLPVSEEQESGMENGTLQAGVLGDENFLERIGLDKGKHSPVTSSIDEIVEQAVMQLGVSRKDILSNSRKNNHAYARAIIAWVAVELAGYSITAVAEYLHRDLATISRQYHRLRDKLIQGDLEVINHTSKVGSGLRI